MSNDARDKGPVENEVEALRAMLEQRRERERVGDCDSGETSSAERSEDESGSGTNAEPATEESE
jgi:hypothetical protein